MTGKVFLSAKRWPISLALITAMGLAACDENGEFAFPTSEGAETQAPVPANAPNQRVQSSDIERPDIFEVTDRGLWDGRPSLGGVWVAHPDVQDPDRVVIRNTENGRSIVGALFRRERENPGPLLQVSSDAAEELGILAGSPTELNVIVLRREETVITTDPANAENPVVASLEAPVTIEAEPLDPVEASETDGAATAAAATAVVLPPALEAATAAAEQAAAATASATQTATETAAAAVTADGEDDAAEGAETIDVSAVLAAPAPEPVVPTEPLPQGSTAQIGVFSVEANAGGAAQTIIASGIQAAVLPEELGGRTVWRVIAGPLTDTGQIAQLKQLGFVDAFVIEDEADEE
ncbi:SPOR domain-containing protein [Yoonia sp. F2084L]|uniref:SPOR domain-containing protein n=1 Tax=Yoonia sp. F2084L TaxID=2926419 RepID=UPI001FF173CF|nr:SPOR domain-containing protein [Yoonia sp. F2084L]MCK0094989.1 SPOR domain-containing protein [Yoonia sp. F2084L]